MPNDNDLIVMTGRNDCRGHSRAANIDDPDNRNIRNILNFSRFFYFLSFCDVELNTVQDTPQKREVKNGRFYYEKDDSTASGFSVPINRNARNNRCNP